MKTEELFKIAKQCFDRTTKCDDCQLHKEQDCTVMLINELSDKLAMALEDMTINCSTCIHKEKSYRVLPCALCEPLKYNKWEWRGNDDRETEN